MQSFQQNRHVIFLALVALKLLVSLISRLVACSPRIVVDTHTHTHTATQNDYCNPRCACAPRVNNTTSDSINSSIAQSHGNKIINCKLGNQVVSQAPTVEPYNYNYMHQACKHATSLYGMI